MTNSTVSRSSGLGGITSHHPLLNCSWWLRAIIQVIKSKCGMVWEVREHWSPFWHLLYNYLMPQFPQGILLCSFVNIHHWNFKIEKLSFCFAWDEHKNPAILPEGKKKWIICSVLIIVTYFWVKTLMWSHQLVDLI